jgi:hypothetical protein
MRTDKLGFNAAEKFCKMSHQEQLMIYLLETEKLLSNQRLRPIVCRSR